MTFITFSVIQTKQYFTVFDDPFFRPLESKEKFYISIDIPNYYEDTNCENQMSDLTNEKIFNINILHKTPVEYIYSKIENKFQEIAHGCWTFISINDITNRIEYYKNKFIDIGIAYIYRGNIAVISYIPDTRYFFVRIDGGSNLSERKNHFLKYSANDYQPNTFPIFKYSEIENYKKRIQCDEKIDDMFDDYQIDLDMNTLTLAMFITFNVQYSFEDLMTYVINAVNIN